MHIYKSPLTTPKKKLESLPSAVHKEVQRTIALKCLKSIKTKNLTDTKKAEELHKIFHGKGEIASQVNLFIEGTNEYGRLYKFEDVHNTGSSTISDWERVLDRNIHRHDKDIVFGGNLTADLIKQTALSKQDKMTGRTLLNYANNSLRESKKICSLVPEAVKHGYLEGPVHGRYSYPSGKTAINLFHFIFKLMFEWDMHYGLTGEPLENENTEVTEEEEPSYYSDYFPQGFFVWWLWGHHPDNDPENYLDVWALDEYSEDGKKKAKAAGRKADRAKEKKEKKSARDYAVANGDQSRGLAYSAASHKELALVEQNERKLNQHELATEIAVISQLMQSKHNTLKSDIALLDNMMKLGMETEARELILSTNDKKEEIANLEEDLKKLVAKKATDQSAHTQHFLKIGAKATRLDINAASNKRKADGVIELDGDGAMELDGDNNDDDDDDISVQSDDSDNDDDED